MPLAIFPVHTHDSELQAIYEFQNSISVFAKVLRGQEPILVHKNLLKRQGSLCRCEFPTKLPMSISFKDTYFSPRKANAKTYIKQVRCCIFFIWKSKQGARQLITYALILVQPEIAISQDSNIPKMITDHKVHVVATSKSLSSIVALEKDRDYDLDIPIRIVETHHPSDATQGKLLICNF